MRSRFTAFVLGDEDHLFRTWHPRTRPPGPFCHPGTRWTRLEIHEVVEGGASRERGLASPGRGLPGQGEAIVEFTAHCTTSDLNGRRVEDALHERSLFRRRGDRWVYVEALPG